MVAATATSTVTVPTMYESPFVVSSRYRGEASTRHQHYSVNWGRFHNVLRSYMFAQIGLTAVICGARSTLEQQLSANPLDIGQPVNVDGPVLVRKTTVDNLTVTFRVCDDSVEVQDLKVHENAKAPKAQ